MIAPDDIYFKEKPKIIIPDASNRGDSTPIIYITLFISITLITGILLYVGFTQFK